MRDGVVVITGVMASGKSTVAQLLAERLPRAAHVRGDAFRRMIVSGRREYAPGAGSDDEATAQLHLRHRLSAAAADSYAEAGFTAVVQDVLLGERLTTYTGLIRTRPLYVVVLAPRPEAVATREAGRPKTGYGAWTPVALDEELRLRTPRIGLWLDSSEWTPAETVDAILAGTERARLA
ncbi:AAA family ATPase [Streptomyces diastatochromogenes]|uniref:Phosphotransferase n=1 Tax=Streptomyces diastatochromogenes TaxID=42236 RepID=A0A233SG35_STRDA|nr:AAA family ATPase [Streptomyces diastatochromogenes]MCZ0988938.1 AAA family ATPase [Streptomyces diastatochromogenes]OXY94602.1 phosphotransferase [Streptomyces diastatochromogenes]